MDFEEDEVPPMREHCRAQEMVPLVWLLWKSEVWYVGYDTVRYEMNS